VGGVARSSRHSVLRATIGDDVVENDHDARPC
jgi:hypothetical protein